MGFSHIAVFIAGQISTGLPVIAIITVVSISSAMPEASLPMTPAVAGAMTARSALFASDIWRTSS
jgi:hypothetical protein